MANPTISYAELLSFALGETHGDQTTHVRAAVDQSPALRSQFARMRRIIETLRTDDSVAPSAESIAAAMHLMQPQSPGVIARWWEQLERVLAAITFDSRAQPALAGYRGAGEGYQLSYVAEGIDVDLEVQTASDAGGTGTSVILGNVAADGPIGDVVLLDTDAGTEIAGTQTDDRGNFQLNAGRGSYRVGVHVGDRVVMLEEIRIE